MDAQSRRGSIVSLTSPAPALGLSSLAVGFMQTLEIRKSQVVFIYLCDLNVPHGKVGAVRFLKIGSGFEQNPEAVKQRVSTRLALINSSC